MLSCTDENLRVVPPMLGTRRSQMISLIIVMRRLSMTNSSGEYCQVQNRYSVPRGAILGTIASIQRSDHSR